MIKNKNIYLFLRWWKIHIFLFPMLVYEWGLFLNRTKLSLNIFFSKVQKPTTPTNKWNSAKNTNTYNTTISQSNLKPKWFRWCENRPIILYEAVHVWPGKPNRFIEAENFFKYIKCDRQIPQANCWCVSQCFSIYCVCLFVCVWLWQGSFQTPQTLMNGSLCVCNCVYMWLTVTFAHSSSHRCKMFSLSKCWSFLSSLRHQTNTLRRAHK